MGNHNRKTVSMFENEINEESDERYEIVCPLIG